MGVNPSQYKTDPSLCLLMAQNHKNIWLFGFFFVPLQPK